MSITEISLKNIGQSILLSYSHSHSHVSHWSHVHIHVHSRWIYLIGTVRWIISNQVVYILFWGWLAVYCIIHLTVVISHRICDWRSIIRNRCKCTWRLEARCTANVPGQWCKHGQNSKQNYQKIHLHFRLSNLIYWIIHNENLTRSRLNCLEKAPISNWYLSRNLDNLYSRNLPQAAGIL